MEVASQKRQRRLAKGFSMTRIRNSCQECGSYKAFTNSAKCIPCRFRYSITPNGCWVWDGYCDPKGYGEFRFYGIEKSAARVSYIIHNGPIPNSLHVLHKCDNPPCVNPDHLFVGTHQDNMRDKVNKGRAFLNGRNLTSCRGEKHFNARLSADQAVRIKQSSEPSKVLAARYGVHVTHINRIRRGAKWAHLQSEAAA